MTKRQGEQIVFRVDADFAKQLRSLAAVESVPLAVLVRELLSRAVRRRAADGAADPLSDTLHTVLPAYLVPLRKAIAATRFDAIVARELARAGLAAALAAGKMAPDKAVAKAAAFEGTAAKVARRRLREDREPVEEAVQAEDGSPQPPPAPKAAAVRIPLPKIARKAKS